MSMPQEMWGDLRARITAKRLHDDPKGYEAKCMLCDQPVFIRAVNSREGILPGYAHYGGMDKWCSWSSEHPLSPDQARALQYQGRQVSPTHDKLCATLCQLASRDPRSVEVKVEEYLPPTNTSHGRFPDVYVDWGEKRFVLELQLSRTFQTEIVNRSFHYDREEIPLIWVLYGIDIQPDKIPQSFRDVIREHRGNAFVIDMESCKASKEQNTLILKCFEREDETFSAGRLVKIDDLTFPKRGLPYFSDRITPDTLHGCKNRRKALLQHMMTRPASQMNALDLSEVAHLIPFDMRSIDLEMQLKLLAVIFVSISHAANKPVGFYGKQTNLSWTINQYYNREAYWPAATWIDAALKATNQLGTLTKKCAERHAQAMQAEPFGSDSREAKALRHFVAEIFDPLTRNFLDNHDALPDWAIGTIE